MNQVLGRLGTAPWKGAISTYYYHHHTACPLAVCLKVVLDRVPSPCPVKKTEVSAASSCACTYIHMYMT